VSITTTRLWQIRLFGRTFVYWRKTRRLPYRTTWKEVTD